jgi:hypothetical protein
MEFERSSVEMSSSGGSVVIVGENVEQSALFVVGQRRVERQIRSPNGNALEHVVLMHVERRGDFLPGGLAAQLLAQRVRGDCDTMNERRSSDGDTHRVSVL